MFFLYSLSKSNLLSNIFTILSKKKGFAICILEVFKVSLWGSKHRVETFRWNFFDRLKAVDLEKIDPVTRSWTVYDLDEATESLQRTPGSNGNQTVLTLQF